MNAISQYQSGIDPPKKVPELVHYVFRGAVIGMLAGLATLFAMSTAYGAVSGLAPAECAVLGSVMTVLLSQPVALVGIAAGATCGATCALVAHLVHRS